MRKPVTKKLSLKENRDSTQLRYEEYSSLRSEITSVQEQQRNIWIAMYTLYLALFVLAVECSSSHILLLAYLILIPFQYIINTLNWSVQKISTYIRCFFETQNSNIHWEGLHIYPKYREHYRKYGDGKLIHYMGATILGFTSTSYFIGEKIYFIYRNECDNLIIDIFLILLALSLLFILLIINLQYKRHYDHELMEVMEDYKKNLNNGINRD